MKLYGTYRYVYTNTDNRYSPSYYLNKELEDYKTAGLFSLQDSMIQEAQYTSELAPGVPSLTRFFVAEYDDQHLSPENFQTIKDKMYNNHYAYFYETAQEAISFLKTQTNLAEESPWNFLLWQDVDGNNVYLEIN